MSKRERIFTQFYLTLIGLIKSLHQHVVSICMPIPSHHIITYLTGLSAAACMTAPAQITREDKLIQIFLPKVSARGAAKGAAKNAPRSREEVI